MFYTCKNKTDFNLCGVFFINFFISKNNKIFYQLLYIQYRYNIHIYNMIGERYFVVAKPS